MTGTDDEEPGGRWTPYESGGSSSEERPEQPAVPRTHELVRLNTSQPTTSPGSAAGRVVGAAMLVAVLAAGGVALAAFPGDGIGGDGTSDSGTTAAADPTASASAPGTPDVLSEAGFADLVDAIRKHTGSTEAFDATLYGSYGSVTVPEDRTSRRERRLYWDGELHDDDSVGTASGGRVDLADVDGATLVRLLSRVTRLVEDPTSTYVIVRGSFEKDGEPELLAYATNDYSETAYLSAGLDGTINRRYVSTEE